MVRENKKTPAITSSHVSGTVEEISADIKDVKVVVASLTCYSTMSLCWEASGRGMAAAH